MKKIINAIFVVLPVIVPFFIILSVIRLCLSPIFIRFEYSLPNFPRDEFGFSDSQRYIFADQTRKFLLGDINAQELYNLNINSEKSLYSQREIDHLIDVQKLTKAALTIWSILSLTLVCTIFLASRHNLIGRLLSAIRSGCIGLLGFVVITVTAIILDFNALFTAFHKIFFTGDSWLFYTSDSLIRLFPLIFWTHLFMVIAGLSALIAITGIIGIQLCKTSYEK